MDSIKKGNPALYKEWDQIYSLCSSLLQRFQQNVFELEKKVEIYGTVDDDHSLRSLVDRTKIEAIQIVTKLNLEIIKLARLTDQELTIEEVNNFESMESLEHLTPDLIDKKRKETQMSKDFKELVLRFQQIQKLAAEKAKEFILQVRRASLKKKRRGILKKEKRRSDSKENLITAHKKENASYEQVMDPLQSSNNNDIRIDIPQEPVEQQLEQYSYEQCQDIISDRQRDLKKMDTDIEEMEQIVLDMNKLNSLESLSSIKTFKRKEKPKKHKLPSEGRVIIAVAVGFGLLFIVIMAALAASRT